MQFTVDSDLEKFSSLQTCPFFTGCLRSGYEGKSVFHVTSSNY